MLGHGDRQNVGYHRQNQSGGEDIAHHTLCPALQSAASHSRSHKEAVEVPRNKLLYAGKELWQMISVQLPCSYILP